MKGYSYILEVDERTTSLDNNINIKRLLLEIRDKTVEASNSCPSLYSFLIRQPIDKVINDFIKLSDNKIWFSVALGAKVAIIMEKEPTQQWVENLIAKLKVDRKYLPCIVFLLNIDSKWRILVWRLIIKRRDITEIFSDAVQIAEKISQKVDKGKSFKNIKSFFAIKLFLSHSKGILKTIGNHAAEEFIKKYIGPKS